MTLGNIVLTILIASLTFAYFLWEIGAERLLANMGRLVARVITGSRIRGSDDLSQSAAIGVTALIIILIFIVVAVVALLLR